MKSTSTTNGVTRHQVRENLQRMILSGERQSGSKLRQQELATRFGVAQGVVREALLELQAYGLVETIDRRGIFVSRLDHAKILEAFEVREAHERLAVRLCCERASREEIRTLVLLTHNIHAAGIAGKLDEMGLLDRELHFRLVHLSGNSMLIRLAENYRILGKFVRAHRDIETVRDEHLAILQSVADGQADRAETLVQRHVAASRAVVEAQMASGEFVPQWVV
ncbi:MAG: GntR family transcriptional regulator [Tepidisphaeraceae bacterium]